MLHTIRNGVISYKVLILVNLNMNFTRMLEKGAIVTGKALLQG